MTFLEQVVRNDYTCFIAAVLATLMLISATVMWVRTLVNTEDAHDAVATFIAGVIADFILVALTYTLWAEFFR